jgi:hypothetical protein
MPEMWLAFSRTEAGAKLLAAGGGQDDRERARDFVHRTLNRHGLELKHCHQFGYDISYVPVTGEFNFHAVLKWVAQTEGMFGTVRALPLPEWRPPPRKMSTEETEIERYSRVAADAVAAALRLARSEMPEASDARLLLLIIGNAAACLGRLRVPSEDVLTIVRRFFEQGSEMPTLPGDPPRYDLAPRPLA